MAQGPYYRALAVSASLFLRAGACSRRSVAADGCAERWTGAQGLQLLAKQCLKPNEISEISQHVSEHYRSVLSFVWRPVWMTLIHGSRLLSQRTGFGEGFPLAEHFRQMMQGYPQAGDLF